MLTRRWRRHLFTVVAGAVTLIGFVWLWWKGVPGLYGDSAAGPDARIQSVTGTRISLLVGLVGVAVLGTLWLNTRTLQLVRSGQCTGRYVAAVEQLGSETIDIRLAGIYALEQLAVDARGGQQPDTIVELLGAFVRLHSDPLEQRGHLIPWQGFSSPPDPADAITAHAERQLRPPADVQAAITVLGRLAARNVACRADLSGACLGGADLTAANLAGADLAGADLTGADLTGADLSGADLSGAVLVDAILMDVTLTGADLSGADLPNSYLNDADLSGADLTGANLTGADLTGARLNRAALNRAYLIEAILRGTDVTAADLSSAKLAGADLADARTLEQHHIDRAEGSAHTALPERLVRPAHWS